jgi:hypothetical protein
VMRFSEQIFQEETELLPAFLTLLWLLKPEKRAVR